MPVQDTPCDLDCDLSRSQSHMSKVKPLQSPNMLAITDYDAPKS